MPDRISDPKQTKVQLNIPVAWEYREHLHRIAANRHQSLASLIREAIETRYPPEASAISEVREETFKAGATS
jgi:hypothetical protein